MKVSGNIKAFNAGEEEEDGWNVLKCRLYIIQNYKLRSYYVQPILMFDLSKKYKA